MVECSLGYFINPLFTILLGVVILKERLRPAQWVAVGIGTAAVVVIAVDYGRPPWIALTLAASFGLYGFLKKQAAVGAADSLVIETSVLAIPSAIALAVVAGNGDLAFGHHSIGNTLLLAGSGVVTAVPLLFFAAATQRLPLSVVGPAAVPDPGTAVPRRRGDPARTRAVRRVHRVLPGVAGVDRSIARQPASPKRHHQERGRGRADLCVICDHARVIAGRRPRSSGPPPPRHLRLA